MLWPVRSQKRFSFLTDLLLVLTSAVLLILAFPKTNIWFFSWIGLIPWMVAINDRNPRRVFGLSYLCGLIFFSGIFYWFTYVTAIGAILLILYFSFYFGLFGLFVDLFKKRSTRLRVILYPSVWVLLEYLRAHFLSGLDWGSMGHSQVNVLPIIQIADITGVYGVSFFLVMVNCLLKEMLFSKDKRQVLSLGVVLFLSVSLVCGYGLWRMKTYEQNDELIHVGIVQGNVPQALKWNEEVWPLIIEKYMDLTGKVAEKDPDMIIWPETAFPGYLWEEDDMFEVLSQFVDELNIPVLFGTVAKEEEHYYNAAILMSRRGQIIEEYFKMHLVPFGEFLPFRARLPFLSHIVPIADFTAGEQFTLFPAPLKEHRHERRAYFSTLICFEDSIAHLSREFVRNGTNLLINITNDAWFQDTKAPFLHLHSALFRTVENRRSLIRATNTGVSCLIDPLGRIKDFIQNEEGKKAYISGYTEGKLSLSRKRTFYTYYGDIFVYGCLMIIFAGVLINIRASRS